MAGKSTKLPVQVRILDERLKGEPDIPQYSTAGSAGMDLRACVDEAFDIQPGETRLIPTGFAMYIEDPSLAAVP